MTDDKKSIVQVLWTDAVTSNESGWTTKEEGESIAREEIPVMSTVGYVIFQGETWISLTDSVGDQEYGQITKIPKAMIIEMKELRYEENNIGCTILDNDWDL